MLNYIKCKDQIPKVKNKLFKLCAVDGIFFFDLLKFDSNTCFITFGFDNALVDLFLLSCDFIFFLFAVIYDSSEVIFEGF